MAITRETWGGWANCYRVGNGWIEALVVADVGPRIMELRLAGGDSLLQAREGIGGGGEAQFMFRGGWRLWIAPERSETTYALDNTPCKVEVSGDERLLVTGPPQPEVGIRKHIEIAAHARLPRLTIVSRIENISSEPLTCAGWSLPVLRPGGRAFVPLDVGPPGAFDSVRRLILWSYARLADPRYRIGDRLVEIDHRQIATAPAVRDGRGDDESKIGVDSRQGWSAYLLDRTLLLKRFPYQPGNYPDGGATIEVYSNRDFLELEHLGPLTTVAPGGEVRLVEDWWLFGDVEIPGGEIAALAALQPFLDHTATEPDEEVAAPR